MTIREEIIKSLNVECNTNDLYRKLIGTLCTCDAERLEPWFKGVIDSLFYHTNPYVLVLEGPAGIGKTHWLHHLWYNSYRYKELSEIRVPDLYEYPIINFDFEKRHLNIPEKDFFKIDTIDNMPIAEKRLASFCSSTNQWRYPQRKKYIVLKVEKIDHELYNSIDKRLLWIEIFNKFKR
jgi:hypothetical protein